MCLWHSWWVFPPQFSLPRNTLRCTQRYVHRWFTILSSCQSRSPITPPKHYFSWMNGFEHKSVLRKRRGTTDTLDGIGFAIVCFVLIFLPSWEPFFIFFQDSFYPKPWSQMPQNCALNFLLGREIDIKFYLESRYRAHWINWRSPEGWLLIMGLEELQSQTGHLGNLGSGNNRKIPVLPGQEEARAGGSAKVLSWSCLRGMKLPRDRCDHC